MGSTSRWRPLSRDESRQLRRGDRLRHRGGREWIVRGPAYLDAEQGEYRVVLVSSAQVVIERERFCDGYVVLTTAAARPVRRLERRRTAAHRGRLDA